MKIIEKSSWKIKLFWLSTGMFFWHYTQVAVKSMPVLSMNALESIDPCGWYWGLCLHYFTTYPLFKRPVLTQLCILKWIPCLESPLYLLIIHTPDSPVQLLNSQRYSPNQKANLTFSCLHDSFWTLLVPHNVAVTLHNRAKYVVLSSMKSCPGGHAARAMQQLDKFLRSVAYTFLKWPLLSPILS
jgi:hypothetical protein